MFKKAIDLAQIPDYTGSSCVHKPTQKEKQHESTPKKQPPLVRLQDQPPPPRLPPRQRQPPRPKKTTTTTKTTTATTKPSSSKQVVLNDVAYGTAFDLTSYNYQNIRSITLQFQGSIPNSGSCLVLGNCWNEQHPIAYSDLQNGTITFQIQNPQDVMTIYNYYGLGSLQAVTLNY